MSRPAHDLSSPDCTCFGCHVKSIQWSPAATPTRRNHLPARRPNNSWEKGVPTDNRGMPVLDADMKPVGQKQYSENRTAIEAAKRRISNTPATP